MLLSQALDYLRYRHNEQGSSATFWADAEIYQLISARAQMMTAQLGMIETSSSATSTVIGTEAYTIPTDAATIVSVEYDGIRLQEVTFRERDEGKANGAIVTGQPFGYLLFNRQLLLVPAPAAVKTLTIYYNKTHPWITLSTDTIDVPETLHPALMDGVFSDMYAKAKDASMATFYENKWTGHMQVTFPNFKLRESQRSRGRVVIDSDTAPSSDHGVR